MKNLSTAVENGLNETLAPTSDIFVLAQVVIGFSMVPIIVVGLFCNCLCLFIYTRSTMTNFINILLCGIAASDIVLLLAGLVLFIPLTLVQPYQIEILARILTM